MNADRRSEERFAANKRPRYGTRDFPPYSYVPGHAAHPVSDPTGHMFGIEEAAPPPLDPNDWRKSEHYLFGVDLFNHGYYWEAHEAWEALWHVAGRTGIVALWLKCLIKVAAAGVKAREGNAHGMSRHVDRALELLQQLRENLAAEEQKQESILRFCGEDLDEFQSTVELLRDAAQTLLEKPQPELLLHICLRLTR